MPFEPAEEETTYEREQRQEAERDAENGHYNHPYNEQ